MYRQEKILVYYAAWAFCLFALLNRIEIFIKSFVSFIFCSSQVLQRLVQHCIQVVKVFSEIRPAITSSTEARHSCYIHSRIHQLSAGFLAEGDAVITSFFFYLSINLLDQILFCFRKHNSSFLFCKVEKTSFNIINCINKFVFF